MYASKAKTRYGVKLANIKPNNAPKPAPPAPIIPPWMIKMSAMSAPVKPIARSIDDEARLSETTNTNEVTTLNVAIIKSEASINMTIRRDSSIAWYKLPWLDVQSVTQKLGARATLSWLLRRAATRGSLNVNDKPLPNSSWLSLPLLGPASANI